MPGAPGLDDPALSTRVSTTTGNRPKRQHYVPRFYLEHFSDENGQVWTYDSEGKSVRSAKPEQTAVETNFYSTTNEQGEYHDDLENWLAEVESNAAGLYPKVLKGEALEGDERAKFAVFLASLLGRSPAMVTAYAEMQGYAVQTPTRFAAANPKIFDAQMDRYDEETGVTTSPEERSKLLEFMRDTSRYILEVDKKRGLAAIGVTDSIAPILNDMRWIVLESPDQHIITSDNPLVRVTPPETRHPIYRDGGFMNKSVEVYIPLSPTKSLAAFWSKDTTPSKHRIDKTRARHMNKLQAIYSERYLFASRRDSGIEALSLKHHAPGVRIRVSGQEHMAKVNVVRKPAK
ncbi:MAG: DUF4238 domain-containing protein [Aestuariivirga sp.]